MDRLKKKTKYTYISDVEMPRNLRQTLVENLKNLPVLSNSTRDQQVDKIRETMQAASL